MAPGGSASPESAKRHKNSVIIASPFITSEVPVRLAVTLFSLSPKRVKNGLAREPRTGGSETPKPAPYWGSGPSALGFGNQSFEGRLCYQPRVLTGPSRAQPKRPIPRSLDPKAQSPLCANVFLAMARQSTHPTKPNAEKNPRRDPTASGQRDASVNRIASHNYFLLEKFETGVVLTGTEVKSIRAGHANLKDSYGLVKDGELWLLNAHIGPYAHGNLFNHAPLRTRQLLVHDDEVRKLIGKTQQRGPTLIPTRMYFKNGKVKVELALAKGKQLWDKRETERRRTAEKEAREAISRSRKT